MNEVATGDPAAAGSGSAPEDRRAARAARVERQFEIPLLIAAALTLPMIVISESATSAAVKQVGQGINWLSWSVFALHLVVMLAITPNRLHWLRHHPLEVAVTVLTPPILPASLQALRAIRLLRLVRLLALVKFSRRVFSLQGLKLAAFGTVLTAIVGGFALRAFEDSDGMTEWEAAYWSLATMTTLGTEREPVSTGGQIVSAVILVIGISFIAMLTGAIAQRFLASGAERTPSSPGDPPPPPGGESPLDRERPAGAEGAAP